MIHENPFQISYDNSVDTALIGNILQGDKRSLEKLVERNQGYIFNVALKLFNSVEDAEEATQEVLVKIITNLSAYNPNKSQFRTWVYRITVNHFLNYKKTKRETLLTGFTELFDTIEGVSEVAWNEDDKNKSLLIDEVKVACTAGMLMCLTREQRLIHILGEIFEIDHNVASEIFEITPDNFRQKLSRTRKDLYQWMNNRCGLVNPDNKCRCHKKTKGFIAMGWIDPDKMVWQSDYKQKIYELSHHKADELTSAGENIYANLYKEHPFKTYDRSTALVEKILGNKSISENLNLN